MTKIINVSGQPIWFQGIGNEINRVEPSLEIIDYEVVEQRETANDISATYVSYHLKPTGPGLGTLAKIEDSQPDYVIVGTKPQAEAYSGRIVTPIPWKMGVTIFIQNSDITRPSVPVTIDTMRADLFQKF